MKKLTAALVIALVVGWAAAGFAAWTVTDVIDQYSPEYLKTFRGTFRVKVNCTADAETGSHTLTVPDVKGAYLYKIVTVPSAAPDAPTGAYTITVKDDTGATMLVAADRSTSATEVIMASTTISGFPMLFATALTITSPGNTKKMTIYLYYDK